MIRANSELQLRYDDIILLSNKLLLSRLSPRYALKQYGGMIEPLVTPEEKVIICTCTVDVCLQS
jgi:hypothetical protein